MKENHLAASHFTRHFALHREVVEQSLAQLQEQTESVAQVLIKSLTAEKKIITFGNGGSATQASHFAGELVGRFSVTRQPFAAIALSSDSGTVTCIGNDFGYDALFERQLQALAQPDDVAFGFTTSGRSENVKRGLAMARKRNAITVAVTGAAGLVGETADYVLAVPSDVTAHVQEVHLMLLHIWCVYIDDALARS